MDICVLNQFFWPYGGGTENVLMEVYSRLARRHNITVLTGSLHDGEKRKVEEIGGIKIVRMRSRYVDLPKAPLPYLIMEDVRGEIAAAGSEIYHINNRFQYGFGEIREIKKRGLMAITIHNSLPKNIDLVTDLFGQLYDSVKGRSMIADADIITGVSKSAISTTVPERAARRAHIVFNGVDHNIFRSRSRRDRNVNQVLDGFGDHDNIILNNGRLVPQKGQAYLLRAARMLVDDGYDVAVVIVGKGPLRDRLDGLADKLRIRERVRFVGGVPPDKTMYYYNAADVFALPSTYEPASVALLESLSSELPTVASRIGGIPEMMGRCGLYSTARDEHSIYNKLRTVLDGKKKARSMAMRGRAKMIKEHDWDAISKRYEELFYSIVRR